MNAPDIPHNQTDEHEAWSSFQYSLNVNMGGQDDITVYFNIGSDDTHDEWIVSEGLKAFYKGIDVTDLWEGCDLDKAIYMKSNEVEQMMVDSWAEHMIDKYADIDD